jgi:hypothetical protein
MVYDNLLKFVNTQLLPKILYSEGLDVAIHTIYLIKYIVKYTFCMLIDLGEAWWFIDYWQS